MYVLIGRETEATEVLGPRVLFSPHSHFVYFYGVASYLKVLLSALSK